jgi:serine/threonine protein kinase
LTQPRIPVPLRGLYGSGSPSSNLSPSNKVAPVLSDKANGSSLASTSAGGVLSLGMQEDMRPLLPGILLHRNHYRLERKLHRQEWPLGITETIWGALDVRNANSPVIIHELSLPSTLSKEAQAIPYTATKVFTSIGRNVHMLPLRDVFSERGRNFFVFESINGLPLVKLLFEGNGKLPEREVVACCLQIVDVLEQCSQQSPPLIHGNVRPECIMRRSTDSQYVLTNFSVALAGGLAQIVGEEGKGSSLAGKADVRTDLGALLNVAHFAATGYWLSDTGAEANSTSMVGAGSHLSPQFRVILLKGLRTPLHQRYQTPAELYQDLKVLHERDKMVSPLPLSSQVPSDTHTSFYSPKIQATRELSADALVSDQPMKKLLESALLVPLPEELPPLQEVNDARNAVAWFMGTLLCLLLLLGPGLL